MRRDKIDELSLEERVDIIHKSGPALKELAETCPTVKFLSDHAFRVELNANDTFGYACADSVSICIEDLPKLLEVEKLYGSDGVTAFMALVDGGEPLGELCTDKYWEAVKFLKDYQPVSWIS